jgi:probable FeS assembly SUF system protein SufT
MPEELLTLTRETEGVMIPAGTKATLFKDEKVYLTQTLGGSFTVQRDNGQLVRVEGKNADALGKPVPPEAKVFKLNYDEGPIDEKELEKGVWATLRTCYDPEIPVNIVELGLIYNCAIKPTESGKKRVEVVMTLTAPGCGMSGVLKTEIEEKLSQVPGVGESFVDVTFDPPWTQNLMTEAAKLQLGMM